MTDKPYPDPPRPTLDDLDPESATTDRLIAMVRSHREGEEYPTAEALLGQWQRFEQNPHTSRKPTERPSEAFTKPPENYPSNLLKMKYYKFPFSVLTKL